MDSGCGSLKYRRKCDERYVWVAYQSEYPYLPIAIAGSSVDLADIIGVDRSTVSSTWYKFRHGVLKNTRFWKVEVGVDDES